jgi:hypothetical protein
MDGHIFNFPSIAVYDGNKPNIEWFEPDWRLTKMGEAAARKSLLEQ